MASSLAYEQHWADKSNHDSAEKKYYEYLAQLSQGNKPECPNVAKKAAAPVTKPKPATAVVPTKKEPSPPKAVAAVPTSATTVESDQSKVKKDKRKNKKNKKDASQSPDPASSTTTESVKESPKASPLVAAAHPVASAAAEDTSKDQAKKKAKKNKKNKPGQETAAAHGAFAHHATTNHKLLTEKENAKNLKEKENLAHKLCDNITEELSKMSSLPAQCTLASEISKARQHIKNSLERMDGIAALAASPGAELLDRLSTVEKENEKLRSVIDGLNNLVIDLHARVKALESGSVAPSAPKAAAPAPVKKAPAPAAVEEEEEEEDDDVDLFGSEDEEDDKAAAELREKRLAEYAAKKSKKPALIAKSNVILDIKPWDDETDMKLMEQEVRKITMDGLLLGASKLVPLAYGIHKLQLSCVIEDDKVSVDELQEKIEAIEDYVQSVDIAAFNKI